VTVSQATSRVSNDVATPEDVGAGKARSWWLTLPGILTGLAGLISAFTGLIVAVQQLRPTSHPATATTQASALGTKSPAANTSAATVVADRTGASGASSPVVVSFSEGRHAQIGAYRYDVLAATARAGNPGELGLVLRVRMTNGGSFGANFWSATFRLRLGASISAPTNMLDDVVAGGTTDVGEVDFTIPSSARRVTLLVGDDASKAVALPISLNRGQR
jgi:hypothetical protein